MAPRGLLVDSIAVGTVESEWSGLAMEQPPGFGLARFMNRDLTAILEEWPYEPGVVNVRVIEGQDGEPRIQLRLDLGLLQMTMAGRPDGQRPEGYESVLELYESKLDEAIAGAVGEMDDEDDDGGVGGSRSGGGRSERPGSGRTSGGARGGSPDAGSAEGGKSDKRGVGPDKKSDEDADEDDKNNPPAGGRGGKKGGASGDHDDDDDDDDGFGAGGYSPSMTSWRLKPEQCREIREEATQYYHRYVCLMVLEDFEGVIRDTTRNLRSLEFCRRFAATREDREAMEPFRPYILMMRTRALAAQAVKEGEPKAALLAIDQGLDELRVWFDQSDRDETFDESNEVQLLRSMRDALTPKLPISQKAELRQRLREAIDAENYELAAILRDELRMLE